MTEIKEAKAPVSKATNNAVSTKTAPKTGGYCHSGQNPPPAVQNTSHIASWGKTSLFLLVLILTPSYHSRRRISSPQKDWHTSSEHFLQKVKENWHTDVQKTAAARG